MDSLQRAKMLYGSQAIADLKFKKIALFGVGGVGSFTAEALARSGVGDITLIDFDEISITNINRQLPATFNTIGQKKATVVMERIMTVQPDCKVTVFSLPFKSFAETPELLSLSWDYVIDAIDDIPAKTELLVWAFENNIPVVSAMGAGNKVDPTAFQIADISKTHTCPLARSLRHHLKRRGIVKGIKTVFSTELPKKTCIKSDPDTLKVRVPGSICHVTGTAGLIVASVVINELTKMKEELND